MKDSKEETKKDLEFMELAIEEAKRSKLEKGKTPLYVGAVVVKDGKVLGKAHRGETSDGDHAEYTLLERKLKDVDLTGATLYTTLEPCTTRNHPKVPCAVMIVRKGLGKVVIGIIDPNRKIRREGVWILTDKKVKVEYFPDELQEEIRELNKVLCKYCRTEIKRGAIKCHHCGEFLTRLRRLWNSLKSFVGILIPICSLLIAILEYQGRIAAVKEKEKAEMEKGQAMNMFSKEVEREKTISKAIEDTKPPKDRYKIIPSGKRVKNGTMNEIKKYLAMGDKFLEDGDLQKTEKFYSIASKLEGEEPMIKELTAFKSLGHLYLQKKEYNKAKSAFEKAIEKNPEDSEALEGLIYTEVLSRPPVRLELIRLELRGCVINDENNWPIEGARISVEGRDESTSSDDRGNFILRLENVPQDFQPRLRVVREGFRTREGVSVSTYQDVIRIGLSPSP